MLSLAFKEGEKMIDLKWDMVEYVCGAKAPIEKVEDNNVLFPSNDEEDD